MIENGMNLKWARFSSKGVENNLGVVQRGTPWPEEGEMRFENKRHHLEGLWSGFQSSWFPGKAKRGRKELAGSLLDGLWERWGDRSWVGTSKDRVVRLLDKNKLS